MGKGIEFRIGLTPTEHSAGLGHIRITSNIN